MDAQIPPPKGVGAFWGHTWICLLSIFSLLFCDVACNYQYCNYYYYYYTR